MTGRGGKGSNTRKPAVPNLAAAGRKKPEKTEETVNGDAKVPNRGRARNPRGRGRGRDGNSKASTIVQSEGTFTMGLSEGTLKSSRLGNQGTEEVIGKLDRAVYANGTSKSSKSDPGKDDKEESSVECEQEEWMSDEDQDQIELYELLKPSIISDLKKGREMPVVLPQKDMDQFQKLVQEPKNFTKVIKYEEEDKVAIGGIAESMQKYISGDSSDLVLMQLPASLDVVHQSFEGSALVSPVKMEVDESKQQASSSSSPESTQKHCMDGLPVEAEIGKLQLLKNGKMRLVIGKQVMEMHQAIPSQMFETIVQTQSGLDGDVATGSMTVLGNVGDSYLCTYNVP